MLFTKLTILHLFSKYCFFARLRIHALPFLHHNVTCYRYARNPFFPGIEIVYAWIINQGTHCGLLRTVVHCLLRIYLVVIYFILYHVWSMIAGMGHHMTSHATFLLLLTPTTLCSYSQPSRLAHAVIYGMGSRFRQLFVIKIVFFNRTRKCLKTLNEVLIALPRI